MRDLSVSRKHLFQKYRSELEKVDNKKTIYNQRIAEVEANIISIVKSLNIVRNDITILDTDIASLRTAIYAKDENIRRLQQQLASQEVASINREIQALKQNKDQLERDYSEANRASQNRIADLEKNLRAHQLRRDDLVHELEVLNQNMRVFAAQREALLRELNRLISSCKAKFDLLEEFKKEFEVGASYDRMSGSSCRPAP